MTRLHELHEHPELDDPVMVVGLDGWIDAGAAAQSAVEHILGSLDTIVIATFDADELLDHRSRRPTMKLVDGLVRSLTWPTIELRAATDDAGHDLLLLVGAEPDHRWQAFSEEVASLALAFECRMVLGLGAYPAPLPHTRPSRLAATATRPELADRPGWVKGTLDVPAGIQAAIEDRAAAAGIPALGMWAQVPHYASALPYPPAALALLEGLDEVAGIKVDHSRMAAAADATRVRLDEAVARSDEHQQLVRQLEAHVDDEARDEAEIPSGDELAAEIQRFLRDQESGG